MTGPESYCLARLEKQNAESPGRWGGRFRIQKVRERGEWRCCPRHRTSHYIVRRARGGRKQCCIHRCHETAYSPPAVPAGGYRWGARSCSRPRAPARRAWRRSSRSSARTSRASPGRRAAGGVGCFHGAAAVARVLFGRIHYVYRLSNTLIFTIYNVKRPYIAEAPWSEAKSAVALLFVELLQAQPGRHPR